ncbi:11916_t:CDS:10 [Acaulospora morrowiae]|uniref:11916_t:CDS:1 n=1 Tax=Acaulospora morrowiae TaxID=94023 RepID=A0A9N9AHF1_9GLOM|nr:11916_t:CDS:10 [Acaulospora morrowiae]
MMFDLDDDYFVATPVNKWSFLGFYEFRYCQDDFNKIFAKESFRLKKSLERLSREGEKEIREGALRFLAKFSLNKMFSFHDIRDNHGSLYIFLWCMDFNREGIYACHSIHGTKHYYKPDVKDFWDEIEVQEERDVQVLVELTCKTKEKSIDEQENPKDSSDEADKDRNKKGPFRMKEKNRKEILKAYNEMSKENMWKLSSGRIVEEELLKLGNDLEFEHSVHSFIIDTDDEAVSDHFSEEEIEEINCTTIPQVPKLSDEITEFLHEFNGKESLIDIRETLKEMMFGKNHHHEDHHDKDYVIYALYTLVREIEYGNIKDMKLEAWFNCHIWNAIFDHAFGDLNVISVVRSESTSLATTSRKNAKRKFSERRKIGHRSDWILRSITNGDKLEFGAGEAGKVWTDDHGTKFLKEAGLKLPKVLKDMLVRLMGKVDWSREKCTRIQTVGIIHTGLMLMMVYLDNPKGYVCRIRRGEIMEVPDTPENFSSALTILASVLNLKAAVKETLKAIKSKEPTTDSLVNAGTRKRRRNISQHRLSNCMSTPEKAKRTRMC